MDAGGGYVEVHLVGQVYKFTPNGQAPGLCSISALIAPLPGIDEYWPRA
jgi:hypothetical protein